MIAIDYKIVRANTAAKVEDQVRDLLALNEGWQPIGPIGIVPDISDYFYQTMIRNHIPAADPVPLKR